MIIHNQVYYFDKKEGNLSTWKCFRPNCNADCQTKDGRLMTRTGLHDHQCPKKWITSKRRSLKLAKVFIYFRNKSARIILNGFVYGLNRRYQEKSFWLCSHYAKTHCKARVITFSNKAVLKNTHNHRMDSLPSLTGLNYKTIEIVRENTIYFDVGNKNPKIIVDNYDFNMATKMPTKTKWLCSGYYKTKCKARATTSGRMVQITGLHNHAPRIDKKKYTNMLSQTVTIIREYAQ
ncbi:unnamed protein product [Phyllotreta striolata]|uniref:FLYWCH-type domain-containing protein n=1 Tax=Phyllotreta striolata TaxID=444603 RepID=A0A9N9XJM6_PHYSR|nr:unnamed protein product [Phyllotreta striolata]